MMLQQQQQPQSHPPPPNPLPEGNFGPPPVYDPNYAQPFPVQQQHQGMYVVAPPVILYNGPGQPPLVVRKTDPIEILNIFLRIVAMATTFIATVITGAAKEMNTDIYARSFDNLITILSLNSLSPIKYFLAANSIVLIYTVATLFISVFSMLTKNRPQQQGQDTLRNKFIVLFVAGDLVAVAFLFSAVGSSAGTKDALSTDSDFRNLQFCNGGALGRSIMCAQWTTGIVMSALGAVAYVILQLLSVFTLQKVNANKSNS